MAQVLVVRASRLCPLRFELSESELQIYRPNGERFLTYLEPERQRQQERQRAEQQAEQERQRAEQAEAQLQALCSLLQEKGINPDQL